MPFPGDFWAGGLTKVKFQIFKNGKWQDSVTIMPLFLMAWKNDGIWKRSDTSNLYSRFVSDYKP